MMEDHHDELGRADTREQGGLRPIPVIIANEVSERIVSASVTANLIIYLTTKYHLGAATSAIIIFVYQAAANFLPVGGAIVSDALLGRYLMVTLTLFSCTIGTSMLFLTSLIPNLTPRDCASPTPLQLLVLCASLGLMALGASGVRPCCLAFAEDQIAHWDDGGGGGARKRRALRALFSWYYVSVGFAQIVAVTILVYFQDQVGWKVGFGISAAVMLCVTLVNLAASPWYVKVKPEKSVWVSLLQVAVVAAKNRNLVLPATRQGVRFHNAPGSRELVPSEKMRFLNKACVLGDHAASANDGGAASTSPWNTCTVEQVENLKSALSVIPMWSAMIMTFLIQSSSFGVLQAATMDRRIGTKGFQLPAGSVSIFEIITFTMWSGCYDRYVVPLLRRATGRRQQVLTLKQRMGTGVFLSVVSMAVASAVETYRIRNAAAARVDGGSPPGAPQAMSVLWLAPQYAIVGLAGAFSSIGQIEFYYAVLPKSMGSFVLALLFLGAGVASVAATLVVKTINVVTGRNGMQPWLSNNLDEGHYNYYYLLLAALGAIDLVYFVVCCYVFDERTLNMSLETAGDAKEMVEFQEASSEHGCGN
ncbi:protein NRT1/ PTR FAMILY 1.2-like [Oryza brachyantha]|uniref:protein NRT1/ PTR FAMILY 1.2-like n=1 Tax=Oryza brachyantha TaxID=4533 RepID=UPI00077675F1|nr:protein NRT1/ PTR FAMILY 1.2-like [Oryza brachyantha]